MSRTSRQRRFIRAAALPAAVAWVGMLGVGGVLMQSGCPFFPIPTPLSVSATAVPATGVAGSYTVTLAATATGGTSPYTYAWTVAPDVTITNPTAATASAAITTAGTYTFTITVTDSAGGTATTTVTATASIPPLVAGAGVDQTVTRTTVVTLTATGTGGTGALTYAWTKVSGVNGDPDTPAAASTTVPTTALGQTTYRITVTDSATPAVTATDDVVVTVTPASLAVAASAVPDSLAYPATATLTATPTEGTPPYTFSWLQTSGSPATLGNAAAQNTVVTFPALSSVGAYTFTVTVQDSGSPVQTVTSTTVTANVTSTSLAFTASPLDNLVGSTGDDTFTASDGQLVGSDKADGGDGTDTLMISLTAALAGPAPTLSNIETISITDTAGGSVLNAANTTGLTTLNFLAPAGAETVNNLGSIPAVNVTSTAQNVTLGFQATTVQGTADALTLALSVVTGGTYTIPGVETISVTSSGSANTMAALTAAALETLNITGDTDLTITAALGNTVEGVAAGTATGAITLTTGAPTAISVTTGSGDDTVTVGNTAATLTLGAGDDTAIFADGQFSIAADATLDTVAGGEGTDTLSLSSGDADAAAAALTNVTGIEALTISNAMVGNIAATFFGTITTVNVPEGIDGANTLTVATGTTVNVNENSTSTGAAVIQVSGTATTDAVTFAFAGANAMASTTDFAKIENVTIDTNTAAGTFTGAVTVNTAGNTRNVTVVGDNNLTFAAAVTTNAINASALTGNLTMSAATVAPLGATITGGEGDDTLIGSAAASVDMISGGDGDDTLTGLAGDDDLTLGAGSDTVVFAATAATNGADVVNDFAAEDVLNLTAFVGDDAPAGTVASTATGNQVVADGEIWIVTDATDAIDTAAELAALFGGGGKPFAAGIADMNLVVIVRGTASTTVWYVDDADSNTTVAAGECVLVATLSSYTGDIDDDQIAD
ncbi:MAG TPA: hypothetical protein PKY77_26245 [Phycisphaerae bacterium]|nr:hypothetical protein [Phycisphaerae bacterium]HRY68219.1 hypothetical protein [Phycisphaerae bacterium]HSA28598.1 hypothetical protein [Phycisphaerae bacterium]